MSETQSFGDQLKQCRLERGLSLEEVADKLRIRRPFLEALESGSWDILPGEAYFKGFLRSYAEYLGLDPLPMLECYQRHKPQAQPSSTQLRKIETELVEPVRRSSSGRKSFIVLGLILLAAVAVGIWMSRVPGPGQSSSFSVPAEQSEPDGEPRGPDLLTQEGAPPHGENRLTDEVAAQPEMLDPPAQGSLSPGPGTDSDKPSADVLALIREGGSSVRVRAHKATRLEILLDDRPAQTYQLQPGAALNWTARLRAHLVVDDPAAINLWVDQQPVELGERHSLSITAVASGREE